MKRKVRNQPSNPYYSDEPAVSKSLIADKPLIPAVPTGQHNRFVPKHPGRMSGVAGFVDKHKPLAKSSQISIPKLGTPAKVPAQGHLRMSGHPGAHRIGLAKKIKI